MSSYNKITEDQLENLGYSEPEMVKLVNTDLLPFFEEYSLTGFQFTKLYKVVQLLGEKGKDFIFRREDGKMLGVWKDYFAAPDDWKADRRDLMI